MPSPEGSRPPREAGSGTALAAQRPGSSSGLVYIANKGAVFGESVDVPYSSLRQQNCARALIGGAGLASTWAASEWQGATAVFLTLTYSAAWLWEPGHIGNIYRILRRRGQRRGFLPLVLWKAEMQQRGAIHYHAMILQPPGERIPFPDEAGWWPWGSTKTETARMPAAYMAKYCGKQTPPLPPGARMFGLAGLPDSVKRPLRAERLPRWIREAIPFEERLRGIQRIEGGGVVLSTGEVVYSPLVFDRSYVVSGLGRVVRFRARADGSEGSSSTTLQRYNATSSTVAATSG